MAKLSEAFEKLLGVEGGYVNDPDDTGGETIFGISRRWHPDWIGWSTVDDYVGNGFIDELNKSAALREAARDLYKKVYWDKFDGDWIASQGIAEELFESIVNIPANVVFKYTQSALNALNKRGRDLTVDGIWGVNSSRALREAIASGHAEILFTILNASQCAYYVKLAASSKRHRKFLRGWVNKRVELKPRYEIEL